MKIFLQLKVQLILLKNNFEEATNVTLNTDTTLIRARHSSVQVTRVNASVEQRMHSVYEGFIPIYTDGAYDGAHLGGAAVVVTEIDVSRGIRICNCQSALQAELLAIADALRIVRRALKDNVVIFTDSRAALVCIRSVSPSQEEYALVAKIIDCGDFQGEA